MRKTLALCDKLRDVRNKQFRKPTHLRHAINNASPHARRQTTGRSAAASGHYSPSMPYKVVRKEGYMTSWNQGALPCISVALQADGAPPPHLLFEEMDELGKVWTDDQIVHLLDGIMNYATRVSKYGRHVTKFEYLVDHGVPLVRRIRRWDSSSINSGRSRNHMLTILIASGETKYTTELLSEINAEYEAKDIDRFPEGFYRGVIRGYAVVNDIEKVEFWLSQMSTELLKSALLIQDIVVKMHAEDGRYKKLHTFYERLYPGKSVLGKIPTECLQNLAEHAGQNFEVSLALKFIVEMGERGAFSFGREEKGVSAWSTTLWHTLIQLRTTADIAKGIDLVKLLINNKPKHRRNSLSKGLEFPRPSVHEVAMQASYVSPYDAIVRACLDCVYSNEAEDVDAKDALQLIRRVTDEIVFPNEPHAVLHVELCAGVLGLAASAADMGDVDMAFSLATCEAIVVHMHRAFMPVSFSTLLHLQSMLDVSLANTSLAGSVLAYIPNFEERLLYYVPGFRDYRISRGVIAGRRGVAHFLENRAKIVIPHWEYFLTTQGAASRLMTTVEQNAKDGAKEMVLLPFSTLSSLQVAGDDMREQGLADNPADASLKLMGAFLSGKGVDVLDGSRQSGGGGGARYAEHCTVLGFVEERTVSTFAYEKGVSSLPPRVHDQKNVLTAVTLAAESKQLHVELLCGGPGRVFDEAKQTLSVLAGVDEVFAEAVSRVICV